MKALILAAGRGSRMGRATVDKPKCLIPIAGKSMFEWQQEAIQHAGIHNLIVAKGYLGYKLGGNFEVVENFNWSKTNMVSTLMCAYDKVAFSNCLVSYSDIVYHSNHVKALLSSNAPISIIYDTRWEELWRLRFSDPLEDAETFEQNKGWLLNIGEKAKSIDEIKGQFVGLIKITPEGFRLIKAHYDSLSEEIKSQLDFTALLQGLLRLKVRIATIPVAGKWCEADSMDDIAIYERTIQIYKDQGRKWIHDWRE